MSGALLLAATLGGTLQGVPSGRLLSRGSFRAVVVSRSQRARGLVGEFFSNRTPLIFGSTGLQREHGTQADGPRIGNNC
jgi:hypothetical protein